MIPIYGYINCRGKMQQLLYRLYQCCSIFHGKYFQLADCGLLLRHLEKLTKKKLVHFLS